jgi:geranylgeranyl reductase family protein
LEAGSWKLRTGSEFDVAIVGAGPAGAWAAYCLAQRGARVALVDGSHPREKPCGGGVSARALALLRDISFDSTGSVDVSIARFFASSRGADVHLHKTDRVKPALMVVSRRELDGLLLGAARAAGADHVARRVIDIARADNRWTITTDTNRLHSAWLIGADGANSLVRRRLSRPFSRSDLSIASGYYVHGRTDAHIDIEFAEDPQGYLWSFPRPDHLAVGICAQADASTSAQLFAASAQWIARMHGSSGSTLTRYSWPIPSLSARALQYEQPAGPGWLLIGDAAGLVDSITREGIFFALQSAVLAAASVEGPDAERAYIRALRTTVHQELRKAARLKAWFFRPAFSRLLVQALQRSPGIRAIMAGLVSGEHTYDGLRRRLLMTGEWRIALDYLRLPS